MTATSTDETVAIQHHFVVYAIRTDAGIRWTIDHNTTEAVMPDGAYFDPATDEWMLGDDGPNDAEDYAMHADLARRLGAEA